jgi:hypothetical protein
MIKGEQLSEEIVRSVVGTLGLIAAVPITTALSALAVRGKRTSGAVSKPRRRRPDPLEVAWETVDEPMRF